MLIAFIILWLLVSAYVGIGVNQEDPVRTGKEKVYLVLVSLTAPFVMLWVVGEAVAYWLAALFTKPNMEEEL